MRETGNSRVQRTADGQRGLGALELLIATSVLAIVVIASVLSPSLGVQTALTGIAILMNLRQPPRP